MDEWRVFVMAQATCTPRHPRDDDGGALHLLPAQRRLTGYAGHPPGSGGNRRAGAGSGSVIPVPWVSPDESAARHGFWSPITRESGVRTRLATASCWSPTACSRRVTRMAPSSRWPASSACWTALPMPAPSRLRVLQVSGRRHTGASLPEYDDVTILVGETVPGSARPGAVAHAAKPAADPNVDPRPCAELSRPASTASASRPNRACRHRPPRTAPAPAVTPLRCAVGICWRGRDRCAAGFRSG